MLQQRKIQDELRLTAAELACAKEILDSKKDPALMYEYLISKGDRYASLANGVARGDSIAGEAAIGYLKNIAASHNQLVTEELINKIRFDMASEYLDLQYSRLEDSTNSISGDINHKEAGKFHNVVFKKYDLPPEAWTLEPVLKVMPVEQREGYWQRVLNSAGNPSEEILLSINTVKMMIGELSNSPASEQPKIHQWLRTILDPDNAGVVGRVISSQLFSFSDDIPDAVPQCNIDINITPSPLATEHIADEDQRQRDVTNGYLINKPTHSLSFTDSSLDNTDFASVQMGSMASGGIRPGEIQLDPNMQPSRYLSEYYLERPAYMLPEKGLFDAATLNGLSAQTTFNTYVDPLLLDLTGRGVTMLSLRDGVLFDIDNSGTLKRTGWAGPDTGMLVIDNGSGEIENISQMFSEYFAGAAGVGGQPGEKKYRDGFAALASQDSDGNGVIDKHDPIWRKLRVWHDHSHDGIVDQGEMRTLNSWRISQINVESTAVDNDNRNGNRVLARSVFMMNGQPQEVLAVTFASSPVSNTVIKRDDNGAFIRSVTGEVTTTAYVQMNHEKATLSADELAVNNVYGGNKGDNLTASAAGSWLVGRGGSNSYQGKAGDDVFVISASDDPNNIQGSGGTDTILITGNKGVALNMARSGITIAQGGDGNDIIVSGGNRSVFIKGGNGHSTLVGGGGNDVLSGGRGKNRIIGGSGKAAIYAGPQGDIIYASEQGSIIHAGGGADRIYGNKSDDVIVAGQGDAVIDGGDGINIVSVHGSYEDYTVTRTTDGYQVEDKVAGRDGTLTLKNIQKLNFADISAVELNVDTILPVNDIVIYGDGSPVSRSLNTHIPASVMLDNDIRFNDNVEIVIANVSDAMGGTVKLEDNGDVLFMPDSTFTGVMSFKYEVKSTTGDPALFVTNLSSGESATMRATVIMRSADIPNDPLLIKQNYLNDINVIPVWQDYTGKGVRIGQFEPGGQFATVPEIFDIQHPDLVANVDPHWLATQQNTGVLPGAISNHASMVAGVMVAAKNRVGGVGVAYEATLGGHYLSNDGADMTTLGKMSSYDVVNHSWVFKHEFATSNVANGIIDLANTLNMTLHYAAANGRGGLGTIIVTAGGNQREKGGSTQGALMSNSRFGIQVAAMNTKADLSTLRAHSEPFSNTGASLLISAPGSHIISSSHQLTAERGAVFGAQYSHEQGTSFAAPIVSGIAALMLQANPNLGYRDVQQILALSARRVDDPATQWRMNYSKNWNGGGMHVSHDYGFGAVDARAAVRLAESWNQQKTDVNQETLEAKFELSRQNALSGGMKKNTSVRLRDELDFEVEQVEVDLSADVGRLGDLTLILVSPNGTQSILLDRPGITKRIIDGGKGHSGEESNTGSQITGDFNHTFMSTHYRGEQSGGQWRLIVENAENGLPVHLKQSALRLLGHRSNPDDIYFYTDEFASLAAEQPLRAVLDDAINGTAGGRNTLNAAAISRNVVVNLADGTANLGGTDLAIRSPDTIHNIISGDGDDILSAGQHDSVLDGGRGRNILTGGAGKDVFVVHKRTDGYDKIINFDAARGELIQLDDFSGKTFSELKLIQQQSDVVIQLSNNQNILIKNQQVSKLGAQHFNIQSTFITPTNDVNGNLSANSILSINKTPSQFETILLSGGAQGVSLSSDSHGKMQASLKGKVYQRDSAEASVFVIAPQENAKDYKNALRGFRHGIDKINLSAVGIRHYSELVVDKKDRMVLQGLALIQGVEISTTAPDAYLNPNGEHISLLYLDGLDVSQLVADDFIFAESESRVGDNPVVSPSATPKLLFLPDPVVSPPAISKLRLPIIPDVSPPAIPRLGLPEIPVIIPPVIPNLRLPTIPTISPPAIPKLRIPAIPDLFPVATNTLSPVIPDDMTPLINMMPNFDDLVVELELEGTYSLPPLPAMLSPTQLTSHYQ
ncbi:S8 family serine peptidase [Yersinia massiliensis]|uniref:S8 family serine peptidase n=1 Tax=Yersinia massiliensis TaxID=419257 RepID=UPI0011A38602|nr:S8 family serine peptidase [Yersinia massiliensis]MCB5307989.1 S8 family serine peptidase [Yersinia massiliensis]